MLIISKIKNITLCLSVLAILLCACSKNEDAYTASSSASNASGGSSTTSCSTISAQSTVSSNGVSYKINALPGAANSMGIEVLNLNGAFTNSYSMQLLELSNGDACATSTSSTESSQGIGKFFEFQNMPAWVSNSSTVSKVNIVLDGNVFSIQN